jgi:adenosylhomocysteinase
MMKRIKDLTVTVTYTVGLSDVEVNEKVFDALKALADRGCVHCDLVDRDEQVGTAFEWLGDNICEADACNWEYEITDMEDYENE